MHRKGSEKSLFFGGADQWRVFGEIAAERQRRSRLLTSYAYFHDVDLEKELSEHFPSRKLRPLLFADSGAFTTSTLGEEVNIREYADWLERWRHLLFVYANLDVHDDPEQTDENMRYLEGRGLRPLPVFHLGFPWEMFERYLERYNYVALGGLATERLGSRKGTLAWYTRCLKMAQGRAGLHLFGVTAWKVLLQFPFFSVDGFSWGQGFKFGQISLFVPSHRRFYKMSLGHAKEIYRFAQVIRDYGFEPEAFADREQNNRIEIGKLSALSWLKAEEFLRAHKGKAELPPRDDVEGPEIGDPYADVR